jgi:hypothetical protein
MKKFINLIIIVCIIITAAFLITGCSEDNTPTGTTPGNTVQGYVRSANGTVSVSGVYVSLTSAADNPDSTYSDANGFYKFVNVSSGNKTLFFSKGSFRDTINITVPISGNVPDAYLHPAKPLAFYWGEFDDIQSIIREMGYTPDSLLLSDFDNLTTLQQYSIIFINCGNSSRNDLNTPLISANLTSFLNGGGRIYASDWAFGCVQGIHPELSGTYDGETVNSLVSNVVYSPLQTYLGKNTVNINYDLPDWLSLSPNNNYTENVPFIRATYQNLTNNPTAFFRETYTAGGKLIYTTFHNEEQVSSDMIKILQFFVFEL